MSRRAGDQQGATDIAAAAPPGWKLRLQSAAKDLPLVTVIVINTAIVVWALWTRQPLVDLLWLYWIQGVGIGIPAVLRLAVASEQSVRYTHLVAPGEKVEKLLPHPRGQLIVLFAGGYGVLVGSGLGMLLWAWPDTPAAGAVWLGVLLAVGDLPAVLKEWPRLRTERLNLRRVTEAAYTRQLPLMVTVLVCMLVLEADRNPDTWYAAVIFLVLRGLIDVGMYVSHLRGFGVAPPERYLRAGRLTRWLSGQDGLRKAAGQVVDVVEAVCSHPHDIRRADVRDFALARPKRYDRTARKLEALGFRTVGDVENVTVGRAAGARICQRLLVRDDPGVCAALCQFPFGLRAVFPRFLWPFVGSMHVEMMTVLSDGHILMTTNVPQEFATMPPEVDMSLQHRTRGLRKLLDEHRRRVREYLDERPAVRAEPVATLADALDCRQRFYACLAAHRERLGDAWIENELGEHLPAHVSAGDLLYYVRQARVCDAAGE